MNHKNAIKILGIAAIVGGLLAVAADLASGYSTNPSAMATALSLSVEGVRGLLETKPHWQLTLGHYLAVFGIPIEGIAVALHTYLAVKPAGRALSRLFVYASLYLVPIGTAYHATYGFIGEIIQAGDAALLEQVAIYFEPYSQVIGALYLALMVYWTALILSGRTLYARWMAAASPLAVMLLSQLALLAVPAGATGARALITVTGLNLPITVWAIASTWFLWGKAAPDLSL